MAKNKLSKHLLGLWEILLDFGRWIGARRVLFVWSAACVAAAVYFGVTQMFSIYSQNNVTDLSMFVMAQFFNILFIFLKLFVPMMMLIIALKYIFDCNGKRKGEASEAFRISFISALVLGVIVGVFYYLDAGHIIGSNSNVYCLDGTTCWFTWKILWLATKAFLGTFMVFFLTALGLRSIYNELTFMLAKK